MEPNKILSANILDLIFDDRNKAYGAYELRVTYPQRVKRSLIIAFAITAVVITGIAWTNSIRPGAREKTAITVYTIPEIPPAKKEFIPPPEPKRNKAVQAKAEKFIDNFKIVPENVDPLATHEDIKDAKIATFTNDVPEDIGPGNAKNIDSNKGIIAPPKDLYTGPLTIVEVDAKFKGNWEKFLTQNLRPDVANENGVPPGIYKVVMRFVVDVDGSVSDITPLTNHGYGMEQEAIRVLKKAAKWEPAFQNGHHVKAYRIQPITFAITEQQ